MVQLEKTHQGRGMGIFFEFIISTTFELFFSYFAQYRVYFNRNISQVNSIYEKTGRRFAYLNIHITHTQKRSYPCRMLLRQPNRCFSVRGKKSENIHQMRKMILNTSIYNFRNSIILVLEFHISIQKAITWNKVHTWQHGSVIAYLVRCWMKLHIHSQTSTAAHLKYAMDK